MESAHVLGDNPNKTTFFPIWRDILSYWFPSEHGFEIVQDWEIPIPSSVDPEPLPLRCTFAVLNDGRPLVLLQIRGTLDNANDIARQWGRAAADKQFDRVVSGPFPPPTLCVISAMGLKWNAFLRPADMTSAEVQSVRGYDWLGEWEEDVTSMVSFESLGYCFDAIKTSGESMVSVILVYLKHILMCSWPENRPRLKYNSSSRCHFYIPLSYLNIAY
jgi:hypothetical protein